MIAMIVRKEDFVPKLRITNYEVQKKKVLLLNKLIIKLVSKGAEVDTGNFIYLFFKIPLSHRGIYIRLIMNLL